MPGVTKGARADVAEALVRTAWATGSDLLGRSVQEAPIETGHLRESGDLTIIVNDTAFNGASALTEAVAYARGLAATGELREVAFEVGFHTPYAAAQHEGWAIMHHLGRTWRWVARNHPKGGKSKYLSDPLYANAQRYIELHQRAVDAVTAGEGGTLERLRQVQGA